MLLAPLFLVVGCSASGPTTPTPGTSGSGTPTAAPGASPAPSGGPATPSEALARTADTGRPWVVVVLGDSTGTREGNWVELVVQAWGAQSGRPVTYREWSVDREPDSYLPVRRLGEGDGAPIVVWNGSAAAQAADYSVRVFGDLVPPGAEDADLVLVSHGHNQLPGTLVPDGTALLDLVAETSPAAAVVVLTQNPEAAGGPNAAGQAAEVQAFAGSAVDHGATVVDVRRAFEDVGDYTVLLDDLGVHPTRDGARLWADAVLDALGPADR